MRRSTQCDYFHWEETHLQFSFNFNSMTYSQWEYGLTLTGGGRSSSMAWLKTDLNRNFACADPEGGRGSGPPLENHKLYGFLRYYD